MADLIPRGLGVEAIRSMITSRLCSGLPRQLMLTKLNRRCSIWGEMRRWRAA